MAGERKGKKLRRITAQSKAYYKLQYGKTDDNRKKRLLKHLRANPADAKGRQRFEQNMGNAQNIGLSSAGKHRLKRLKREQREAA